MMFAIGSFFTVYGGVHILKKLNNKNKILDYYK